VPGSCTGCRASYWSNLPDAKRAARQDEHLVQFVHHEDLPTPRITGYEHHSGVPLARHGRRRRAARQSRAHGHTAFSGIRRRSGHVVNAEREQVDRTARLPFRQAALDGLLSRPGWSDNAPRQLWREASSRSPRAGRHPNYPFAGREPVVRDVAVDPFHLDRAR